MARAILILLAFATLAAAQCPIAPENTVLDFKSVGPACGELSGGVQGSGGPSRVASAGTNLHHDMWQPCSPSRTAQHQMEHSWQQECYSNFEFWLGALIPRRFLGRGTHEAHPGNASAPAGRVPQPPAAPHVRWLPAGIAHTSNLTHPPLTTPHLPSCSPWRRILCGMQLLSGRGFLPRLRRRRPPH